MDLRKTKNWVFGLLLMPIFCLAQNEGDEKAEISVDLLRSPSSPAFTVLGLQTTDIERPTNPTDLLLSVRNSSEDFTTFPNSYSLEFAPGWVFGGDKITYEDFKSDNFKNNLIQNTVLSFAINTLETNDSISTTQIAVGVKFSLLRGKMDGDYGLKRQQKDSLDNSLSKILDVIKKREDEAQAEAEKDPRYTVLQTKINEITNALREETKETVKEVLQNELRETFKERNDFLLKFIKDTYEDEIQEEQKRLQKLAEQVKFEREGFKLDLSLATSWNFNQQKIEDGKLFNYGAWLTGAYDLNPKGKETRFSLLGTARLLYSPDEEYEANNMMLTDDNLRFDIGGRLVLDALKSKLSVSAEALYRSVLNNDNIDDTHKLVFNLEYEVAKNKLLTLSLGRDFDGNFSSDGNLVAFLNLVVGIGSKRPF